MRFLSKLVWFFIGLFTLGCLVDFPNLQKGGQTDTGNPSGLDSETDTSDSETTDTTSFDTDTDVDTDADTDTGTGSDTESETASDSSKDTDSQDDTDSGADTDTDVDTDTDTDADGDTDTDADADTDTDTDSDTDSESVIDSETVDDTDTSKVVDTDSMSGTDTGTASDTDSTGETDSITDTVSETDTLETNHLFAKHVTPPPLIDGIVEGEKWVFTNKILKLVQGSTENQSVFDVLWDETNLYILVRVFDEELCVEANGASSWTHDSVEIYIDPDLSKGSRYDAKDVQMIFKYVDANGYVEWGSSMDPNFKPRFAMKGGLRTDDILGYLIEVSIMWADLNVKPTPGTVIGFDIGVNDDDRECSTCSDETLPCMSREGQLRWNGDEHDFENTSLFGEVELSAEEVK